MYAYIDRSEHGLYSWSTEDESDGAGNYYTYDMAKDAAELEGYEVVEHQQLTRESERIKKRKHGKIPE